MTIKKIGVDNHGRYVDNINGSQSGHLGASQFSHREYVGAVTCFLRDFNRKTLKEDD